MTTIDVGRRSLIKRATATGLLTVPALAALSACATGGGGGTQQVAEGKKSARNPLAVNESAGLDVVIFDGGFGEEYAKAAQAEYVRAYPKADGKIKHSATQKIQAKLAPRFNGGTPPDLIDN
ncbi:carbohydrate ABC transporter, N-acetylglucosamine/diacetylchitobiose-binding protein, partial [Streptomyces buecherae]